MLAKQAYARIGGPPKACILLANLHLFELSCYRNTISKGSGSGITIVNVKAHKEDMSAVISLPTTETEAQTVFERCVGDQQRVAVVDNYVVETVEGYGMVIDQSSCYLELNQLKKNAHGGLLVTSSSPVLTCNSRRAGRGTLGQNDEVIAEEPLETARSFGDEDG